MGSGNMQQMTALQHQQIRSQQGMVSGSMAGNPSMNQGLSQSQVMTQSSNPMAQMNNMNQAILHMQQQQQQQHTLMQQQNPHVSTLNGLIHKHDIYNNDFISQSNHYHLSIN